MGFGRPVSFVVANPKGGAGKTPVTLLLAGAFGVARGGGVLAWDNNELRGTMNRAASITAPLRRCATSCRRCRIWCRSRSGTATCRDTCARRLGLMPDIKDLEPLIGRWRQVVDAPRHVEEKVEGDMTLEWLRDEKVILQRSIAENPMFPEGVVLIMAADEDAEGDFTAHYFDSRAVSRVLHMSFQDGVWKWWRHATHPDDFDQRFEGTLSEDGKTIESSCYLVEDGEWIHDFDVTYTRA
jgi:hypothetical protein